MRVLTLGSIAVLVVACGPAPGSQQCSWSGARSGSASCRLTSAAWMAATNALNLRVQSDGAGSTTVSAEYVLQGKPGVGTYTGKVAGTGCAVSVVDGSAAPTYASFVASTTPGQEAGSCTLTVTAVSERATEPAYTVYELKGSFSAVLQGVGGTPGAVELAGGF